MSALPPLNFLYAALCAHAQRFNLMSNQMPPMFHPFPSMIPDPNANSILSSSINTNTTTKMTPKVNHESARPLIEWFDAHLSFPYPSYEDMKHMKQVTGFTDTQLGDWFRNRRRNYKKKNGSVPWKIPPMSARKRRASSTGHDTTTDDSNSSIDSASTTLSSPPSTSSPTNISNTSTDDGFIDVVNIAEKASPVIADAIHQVKEEEIKNEDDQKFDATPPIKRLKLWTVDDMTR